MTHVDVLGGYWLTFILFTCVAGGWLAFMTGTALANTWRPMWQIIPYGILLALAERFFNYALFGGDLLSLTGLIIDAVVLLVIAMTTYRITLAYKVVLQYPWHYERRGLFSWRARG